MRVVFLSDTHTYRPAVPDGDLLIHCGDCLGHPAADDFRHGMLPELQPFLDWFGELPHPHKVLVAGNHDWVFERMPALARQMCEEHGVIYLEDQGKRVGGLYLYGTPAQPYYCGWAFNVDDELDLEERYQHIPGGLDILITHCPPFGILDEARHDFKVHNIGPKSLREAVERAKPRVHAFGHCHMGYGQKQIGETLFINAAIWWTLGANPKPKNAPVVIDLEPR